MADNRDPVIDHEVRKYTAKQEFEGNTEILGKIIGDLDLDDNTLKNARLGKIDSETDNDITFWMRQSGHEFIVWDSGATRMFSIGEDQGGADLEGYDLSDRGTTVWDATNDHVPSGSVESAGLDADSVDGYEGADLGALSENETISGAWDVTDTLTMTGAHLEFDGTHSDTTIRFCNRISGTGGTDQSVNFFNDDVYINSGNNGSDKVIIFDRSQDANALEVTENGSVDIVNHPLHHNGNPVPSSSTGTQYDIQKNGTDGSGVINFKT